LLRRSPSYSPLPFLLFSRITGLHGEVE
jgi:hypothetical protein